MQEQGSSESDRREDWRVSLTLPRAATFDLEGKNIAAEMIDLSSTGAKFRFTEYDNHPPLKQGRETSCTIHLDAGKKATIRVSVRWALKYPEGITLGVRFADSLDNALFSEISEQTAFPAG